MRVDDAVDWRHDALAAAAILLVIPLLLLNLSSVGPTVDEPFHLVRGLAWWWTDSTKLSYAHPPLANLLQALPAVLISDPIDLTRLTGWEDANHAHMAETLFATRYPTVRPMLHLGRLVTMGFMVAMCLGTYLWTSRRLGGWIGLATLLLIAFNPTVLAHAQLLTTDLPVAAILLLAGATFVDYLSPRRPRAWRSWLNLGVFALAMGAALITKFTAVSMVPLFAVVGGVWAWQGWGRFRNPSRGRRLLRVAAEIGVVAAVGIVLIGAIYRFEAFGLSFDEIRARPEPQCHLTEPYAGQFLEGRRLSANLPGWLRLPVPYTWWFGFEMVRYHGSIGHPTWFAGFQYGRFNPLYFPIMLLIKNPATWLIGLGSVVFVTLRRRSWPPVGLAIPSAMGLGMMALLATSNLNIGVRHALPIIVLWSLPAGAGLVWLGRAWLAPGGRFRQVVVGALLVSMPLVPATVTGHYLGYFNIGKLGYAISVVGEDWGQDVPALAAAAKKYDMEPLRYMTYGIGGAAELRHLGVKARVARCGSRYPAWGWVVLHRSAVERWPECTRGVGDRPPDLVIGDHIYAWDLRPEK